MKISSDYYYGGFVKTLSSRVAAEIDKIFAVHNFEYGAEFEIALCMILRDVLPSRFGICRGYIVDINSNIAGDDIIIFDRSRFPTFTIRSPDEILRKEYVPIEAVYAYIEAKHTLQLTGDDSSLQKGLSQINAVRRLCSGRNSIYCMIFARQVSVDNVVGDTSLSLHTLSNLRIVHPGPDAIIAGPDIITRPTASPPGAVVRHDFNEPAHSLDFIAEPYHVAGVAFGCALLMLMKAIVDMKLDDIKWLDVLNDAMKPRGSA
jgi:hypothetical protein